MENQRKTDDLVRTPNLRSTFLEEIQQTGAMIFIQSQRE